MIKIKSDKIITPNGLVDGYLYFENGKIKSVSQENLKAEEEYDFTGKYVSAGFIDMHTHGAGGFPYMETTEEKVVSGANLQFLHGVTTVLPTISAGEFYQMENAVECISKAKRNKSLKPNILGAHLEGPYLSKNQSGAQGVSFITAPKKQDYTALIDKYGKDIARWTYAPENDENAEFCKYLTDKGIIASAGHTDAKLKDIELALKNGCNLITHFYSCTSTVTRDHGFRSGGVIEAGYLFDDMFVEIIADGKHLPIELVKLIIKLKGTDKVALITDSLDIAGTDIKEGNMNGTEFIVEDGVCKLKDRSAFAGSIAMADTLIRFIAYDCGYGIETAVKMMTEVPSNILKLNKGKLEEGKDADIIVFDDNISVSDIFVLGKKLK